MINPTKPASVPRDIGASERMELYFVAHPGSPAAVRRPRLSKRGNLWVALLGRSIAQGITGLGPTVEAALRAFDTEYLNALHRPIEVAKAKPPLANQRAA